MGSFLRLIFLFLFPLPTISLSSHASIISHSTIHPGSDTNTVPALPVESQAQSCLLDLNNQLFGGVKEACQGALIDRRRCCPVLEAWLMAARAKVAFEAPAPLAPGMPLLPDDSMVCVANMNAALDSRGLHLTSPNSSCDVVICFCGIRLNEITMANCPISFYESKGKSFKSVIPSESSLSRDETNPIVPEASFQPFNYSYNRSELPFVSKALEANCTDYSYKGCTKCLSSLQKIAGNTSNGEQTGLKKIEKLDCELMGLMGLLAINKTLYIPSVSAVLRALLYSDHSRKAAQCSPDWANMPLAMDSTQIEDSLAKPTSSSQNGFLLSCSYTIPSILLNLMLLFP